jgi:UPF0755 protein
MRKYLVFLSAFFILFIAAAGGYIWYRGSISAPSVSEDSVRFVITKGSSANKIGSDLEEAGLIKSALAFKFYTQLNDIAGSLPPGEFSVPQNLGLEGLIAHLMKGPSELWVTIPEGLRREEVVEKVIVQLGLPEDEAISFREEFLSLTRNDEGHLFPDTYLFPKDATPQAVSNKLISTYETKFDYSGDGVLSREEAVVLASIIERETITDSERPIVAGVLLNRMNNEWPLQADATAQYALGTARCQGKANCDWWEPPLRADLEVDSPYNTYVITGLPPAPISNPGISSLNAAASPADTDYFYYIHDRDGNIHFAETLDEHNENVSRYIR